jgi:hypothetical protein
LAVELLEVPAELIQTALDLELAGRTVIADMVGETACIFLAGLYRAEQVIAERILRLANGKLPWPLHRLGEGTAVDRAEDRFVGDNGQSDPASRWLDPADSPLVQFPGTGVIWKICPM